MRTLSEDSPADGAAVPGGPAAIEGPVIQLDGDGRVRSINPPARALLDRMEGAGHATDLVGLPAWIGELVTAAAERPRARVWYTDALVIGQGRHSRAQAKIEPDNALQGGTRISLQHSVEPEYYASLAALRERVVEQLSQQQSHERVLAEIGQAVECALPGCVSLVRHGRADTSELVGGSAAACRAAEELELPRAVSLPLPAARQEFVTDFECASPWSQVREVMPEVHAALCLPITGAGGDCFGCLYVFYGNSAFPLPGHETVVREFACLAGMALAFQGVLRDARHEANHDGLTGLINRRRLLSMLRDELAVDGRGDRVALLLLDIDDFKAVNDTSGHGVGDSVLMVVADRLLAAVRPGDAVARLGGDEFVVVMRDIDAAGSEHVAGRLLTSLREPIDVEGVTVRLTPSMGLVLSADFPDCPPERLLDEADGAMYLAKREGKDGMRTARDHDQRRKPDAHLLELLSDPAVLDECLLLNAWVRWHGADMVARQLLLQWRDRSTGEARSVQSLLRQIQTPDVRMEVQKICREAIRDRLDPLWFADGMVVAVRPPRPALLDPAYPEFLAGCLQAKGALPPQMELDVSEIMGDPSLRIRASLDRLREHLPGLRIAVRTLEQNPLSLPLLDATRPDVLRVSPRELLTGQRTGMDPSAALAAMCMLGRSCHAQIVGDHVSTMDELHLLHSQGVQHWQGPYGAFAVD